MYSSRKYPFPPQDRATGNTKGLGSPSPPYPKTLTEKYEARL